MITIYQIKLNKSDRDQINAEGHTSVLKQVHRLDLMMGRDLTSDMMESFEKAYDVETNDLDEAFHLTNIRATSRYTEYGRSASSSVGDLFEMENGDLYICRDVGFEKFNSEVAA